MAFLWCSVVGADQQSDYKRSIEKIGGEIKKISRNLNANKALLKTEQDQLLKVEQKVYSLIKSILISNKKIEQHHRQSKEIDQQLILLKQQQKNDQQALSTLLVNRYTQGSPSYIKMLLNQENPYAVGRLNNYYDYFSTAQREKIIAIRARLKVVQQLQQEKQTILAELEKQQTEAEAQQQALASSKRERQQTVDKLNVKVVNSNEKLVSLKKDRNRLNNLLKKISAQAEKLRRLDVQRLAKEREQAKQGKIKKDTKKIQKVIRPLVKGGFIKQRGRLKYPVNAQQNYQYGSRLPESGMRAQGIFFNTGKAQSVKAIFRGRVLFADFLKGYGLLLIVDHGDDHISLYGHNELIYKQVGDLVDTQEVVAKTGTTGGLKTAGLYFEIRKNATPVNPSKWCQ